MKESLINLLKNSHSPYSKLAVACIIETKDNNFFAGVNVENASYKDGLCAEQNALAAALTSGYKGQDIIAINIMGNTEKILKPCFLCRQLLSELLEPSCFVNCYNNKGQISNLKVQDLCPFPFGEADLPGGQDEE